MNLTPQPIVYLFMLVIYVIIIYIFDRARRKFRGGNIELVIKLIIINNLLLLAADFTYLLKFLDPDMVYTIQTVLRLAAMCLVLLNTNEFVYAK